MKQRLRDHKKRTISSHDWLTRHINDPFVQRAKVEGYRSRAAYKLLEIQKLHSMIRPGMHVVDLGAAPGGWSQVVQRILSKSGVQKGKILAVDMLDMDAISGVDFVQKDFTDLIWQMAVIAELKQPFDVILSDMAPATSGYRDLDQGRIMVLAEQVLDFAKQCLKPGGGVVVKVFQGGDFEEVLQMYKQCFAKIKLFKPDASRKESKEMYLLAFDFKFVNDAKET